MGEQAKRFALLVGALCVMAVALVGCQVSGSPGGSNTGQTYIISTPNASQNSPTPTFPPFTVGAWPSNYSPNNNDTITIYVLCRVQNQSMSGPAQPPGTALPVNLNVGYPIDQTFSGSTDANGLAAIVVTFNDPRAGYPVTVTATVTYQGTVYTAQTFFTPSPASPTPTPTTPTQPTPPSGTTTPTTGG